MTDDACPFCGERFTELFRTGPRPEAPTARLTRAAIFALGSGTLALAPGCSASFNTGSQDGGDEDSPFTVAPPYGAFPIPDGGFAVAAYGGPGLIGLGDDSSVDAEPNGGPCSTADDCGSGDTCLFPIGGGCTAQGHCGTQDSCTPQPSPTLLCVCGIGGLLELQCAPSAGYVERTTLGMCTDAGGAADTGTADAPVDAGGAADSSTVDAPED